MIAREASGTASARISSDVRSRSPAGGRAVNTNGGVNGEFHLFNPETIAKLQHSVRQGYYSTYKEYAELVNHQAENLCTCASLFRLNRPAHPVARSGASGFAYVRRFATGAMSFGSISGKPMRRLAIAMNRIGGPQ